MAKLDTILLINRIFPSIKVAWIHFERSAILTVHSQVITRNPRVGGIGISLSLISYRMIWMNNSSVYGGFSVAREPPDVALAPQRRPGS